MARAAALAALALGAGAQLPAPVDFDDDAWRARRLATNATETYCPDMDVDTCTPGRGCGGSCTPEHRGFCVVTDQGTHACWDVCNPNHPAKTFKYNDDDIVTATVAGMVYTVRSGHNPQVHCPGMLFEDSCPPGHLCPAKMLQRAGVQEGRGLCVVDATSASSRGCWDMCDTTKLIADFTIGTAAGTAEYVHGVRNSSVCPHLAWFWILLTLLGIVAMALVCVGMGMCLRRRLAARRSRESGELKDFGEALHEDEEEDGAGGGPPETHDRQWGMEGGYAQEPTAQEQMPPEPPRMDSGRMGPPVHDMPGSPYGYGDPSQSSRGYGGGGFLPAPPMPPSQTVPQSSSPYSPGGRPIPGLQEPENLLNLTQQQLASQSHLGALTTAISAPPVGGGYQPSFTSPPMYSGMQPPQLGGSSFHTVPPQSLQMGPGQLGSPPLFSATAQRR